MDERIERIAETAGDTLAVVGLGYVGLPLAVAFGRKLAGGRLRRQPAEDRGAQAGRRPHRAN